MKRMIAFLLCVLLLTGCAQVYEGPTETVWVVSETTKEQITFDLVRQERVVYAYDIYGRVAQTMEYWNEEERNKTVYTYDDHGNLLREEYYSLSGWFPKRRQQTFYTYDEQDRRTSMIYEFGGKTETEHRYAYDDEANTRTTTYFGSVTIETFDENGNLERKEYRNSDGTELTEYTLRPDGQPMTARYIEVDGRDYTRHLEYDEHGECIAMTTEEAGVFTEDYRYRYEYDDQGRKLRKVELTGSAEIELTRWEYDDLNRSVTIWTQGERDTTIRYDDAGREIERISYDSKTGEAAIIYTYAYRPIQVPAKEETP